MSPPLDGIVLLTGASSGIGLELARRLAERAKVLILVARRRDRLEALAAELARPNLEVSVEPADLADPAQVRALINRVEAAHGGVDVLVNNAGLGDVGLFELAEYAKIEHMLRVNVDALTLLTHAFLPRMVANNRGGILNVSSGFGLTFMPGVAAYVGSKHYVSAFTESLRLELRGTGVVVSQLCPGPVPTEFESVAGNPVGRPVPGIFQVTAERCAAEALRGFAKGRAIIIPGGLMRLMTTLGDNSPRWMLRLTYAALGPALRKKQQATLAAGHAGRAEG